MKSTMLSKRSIKIIASIPVIMLLLTVMLCGDNPELQKNIKDNEIATAMPELETTFSNVAPKIEKAADPVVAADNTLASENKASTKTKSSSSKTQPAPVNYGAIDHPLSGGPTTMLAPLPTPIRPQPVMPTDFEMSYDLWSQFSGQFHALSKLDYTKEKDIIKFNLTEMGAIEAINRITIEKVKEDKYLFLEPPTFTIYVKAQTLYWADRDARNPILTPAEREKAISKVNTWIVSFDTTLGMYKTELDKL